MLGTVLFKDQCPKPDPWAPRFDGGQEWVHLQAEDLLVQVDDHLGFVILLVLSTALPSQARDLRELSLARLFRPRIRLSR